VFRFLLWGRSDCCPDDLRTNSALMRLRSDAVTSPPSSTSVLWSKQIYQTYLGLPVYYYPNQDNPTLDVFLSFERTYSPTTTSVQSMEIEVYMKSNPTINVIAGSPHTRQDSEFPGYPSTNAVDGNYATFTLTGITNADRWWIALIGGLYYGDIDRIVYYNPVGGESMVGATIKLRNSTTQTYVPVLSDSTNVLWSFTISVVSLSATVGHSYRPIDVESNRWTSQLKIVPTSVAANSYAGYSVAINQNDTVIVVGGYGHSSNNGAIWIYHRIGSSWNAVQGPLTGTGGAGGTMYQGASVDIYDSTIVVGGNFDNSNAGRVWIYDWDGVSSWYQTTTLLGTGATGAAQQGECVSIHGDTLAFGGPTDASSLGAVWVYTRSAGTWSQQGSKLVGTGYTGSVIYQGKSVCVWADSLAIGGFNDNSGIGAVWVFTRSAGTWSQQGSKITPTGYVGTTVYFGYSVSLERDNLAVGAVSDNGGVGAVYFYTRSGSTWTQQQRLVGSNPLANQYQGFNVKLWNDYMAVGASQSASGGVGSAYVYRYSSSTWREVRHVTGTSNVGNSQQGMWVAIRNRTLVVGGSSDDSNKGAIWRFFRD